MAMHPSTSFTWWNVFRMIDGGKTLEDFITVEDPGIFTTPWPAAQRFRRENNSPHVEDICAENNFAYFGYDAVPLPQAVRADF
jgi:hypothetical protein